MGGEKARERELPPVGCSVVVDSSSSSPYKKASSSSIASRGSEVACGKGAGRQARSCSLPSTESAAMSSTTEDSPSFLRSFERWRVAITSLTVPVPAQSSSNSLRCDEQIKWEQGAIMQQQATQGVADQPTEKSEADLKREAKECKRCERWRDDLTKESEYEPCTAVQQALELRQLLLHHISPTALSALTSTSIR